MSEAATKITEMLPRNMPAWADKAMMEGTFFHEALRRIEQAEASALKGREEAFIAGYKRAEKEIDRL